ncbi:MAG: 50S ribosomal protein L29 [Candidatus Saccharimonadales bacterium]
MKTLEMRKQSIKELRKLLSKQEAELLEFVADVSSKKVADNSVGNKLRKDIARIKTLIKEKELEEELTR